MNELRALDPPKKSTLLAISNYIEMSELDILKEKIAYLKLWLGIFVVTDISLIGWLLANYEKAKLLLLVSDILGIFSISIAISILHKRIEQEIEQLREL